MSVLVDWQIQDRCLKGMIEPYDSTLLNPTSLDIRVGDTAKLFIYKEHGVTAFLKRKLWQWFNWGSEPEVEYLDIDLSKTDSAKPYWLKSGDRILVASLETFNLPDDVAAQFLLKSSRGREFYEHLLAGWCDPGWNGSKLTMEIINHSLGRLPLYKGFRLGQMIFYSLDALPRKSYRETGRYNGDTKVQESRG
jgi:dCTP deaminase